MNKSKIILRPEQRVAISRGVSRLLNGTRNRRLQKYYRNTPAYSVKRLFFCSGHHIQSPKFFEILFVFPEVPALPPQVFQEVFLLLKGPPFA